MRSKLSVIAHADWSIRPAKRQVCIAERDGDRWRVSAPRPVDEVAGPRNLGQVLVERAKKAGGGAFLGLDVVLGLPEAWAVRAGVPDFPSFLRETVHRPPWENFWEPASSPDEISIYRPFYPRRPGGTRQHHLVERLGLPGPEALRRRCDLPRTGAPTPCPLFWTLGANQVGKATLSAWQLLVLPLLEDPSLDMRIWPFDGSLSVCLEGDLGIAEVYPGEIASQVVAGLRTAGGKRSQSARRAQAPALAAAVSGCGAVASPALSAAIASGFGGDATGEDAFDSFLGLVGTLTACIHADANWEPEGGSWREIEGWVLGRPSALP